MDTKKTAIPPNLDKANRASKTLTRECIRTALMYLMEHAPLSDITTTSIIKRAGVSRSGFYRNYACKEEVLQDISNTLSKKITLYYKEELITLDPYTRYVKLFERLKDNAPTFDLLLKSNLQHDIIFDFEVFINQNNAPSSPEEHYHYIGMVYAHRFIMRDWFQNGMKESPEEMASILCKLFN